MTDPVEETHGVPVSKERIAVCLASATFWTRELPIYALVLGPMAHVAALRETSVLFGALMGTLLLGEPFGRRRVIAAAVIVAGLALMNGPRLF